jgi:hypothetical protein
MTREEELANLLEEIGLERGVAIEQLVEDLARLLLPNFIDAQAFRAALLDALEGQLRAQLEVTIAELRQRFGVAAYSMNTPPLPPRSLIAPTEPTAQPPAPELPDDATIHWEPGPVPRRT